MPGHFMSIDERMLAAIRAIYDAALDEALWPEALKQLVEITGSQAATFWVLDGSGQPRLPAFQCVNFDPAFVKDYLENVVPLDPTVQFLVRHPDQPIVHDGLVIAERDKDRHPYYDWHTRHSDTRFRLVGQMKAAPGVQAGVALHRIGKSGRYEAGDIERFAQFYPHLERALAIGIRMSSLSALERSTAGLLDRDPAAILLLDERKRIVYLNRRAEDLRSDGDGIRLSADGIWLARKHDDGTLQSLIRAALLLPESSGAVPGGAMRALRPSGKRPYTILVAPVSRQYPALSLLRPAVCIVIVDPDDGKVLGEDRLQTAFGLTAAEARLAILLAAGEELRPAAAKLGITYGTARSRLAAIFQKTGTRRQAELIKLLLTTFSIG